EFLDWPEYTIDLFADFEGNVISVVPRRRVMVVSGESYVSATTRNDRLVEASIVLAKKLELVGHNTLQAFCQGSDVKWIEVNPRFGGACNLGFQAGAHTPSMLVLLVAGEKLSPQIGEYAVDLVMLRYTQDLFVQGVEGIGSGETQVI